MSITLTSLLAAAAFGSALLAVWYFALRNSVGTVALLLAVWIATIALRDSVDLSVVVGSLRITALDALSGVLAVVGAGRALSYGVRGMGRGLVLLLLLLVLAHITRGVSDFGIETSVNAGRDWLYFTAALIYAATVPGGWDRRVWKVLAAGGTLLAVIAVPYFVADGVGAATELVYREGEWVTTRPVAAAGGLLVLQAAILAPTLRWPSRQASLYVAFGAGVGTLLLQHRTLWVAGLLVGVLGFIWWSTRRNRDTVVAAAGVLLLLLPVVVWGFSQTGPLVASAAEPTNSNSTFIWRTSGWEQLIASHDSASQIAAGNPSGNDLDRMINGSIVDVSPHNGFVDAYLRFGLSGVLILSWLGLLLWFRRSAAAAGAAITPQAVALLLLTQFVFSMAYSLDSIQGVIGGILVSGLAAVSPVSAAVGSRSRAAVPAREYAFR